ncbi:pilin [Patescibacteria group bacterium]|nr:pilin [Patescibacteria group bacterium]
MPSFLKKILLTFPLLLMVFLLINNTPVSAANGLDQLQTNLGTIGSGTGLGDKEDTDITGRIANIINIILGFLGIIAVIFIMFAGFKWMTAGGNEETVTQAKATLKNAVIGIGIVLLSFVIVNFAVSQLSDATGGGGGGDTTIESADVPG